LIYFKVSVTLWCFQICRLERSPGILLWVVEAAGSIVVRQP
jgi:hypothetical protein